MPRKRLIRSRDFPYHLTARANNREEFAAPLEYVWRIITLELYRQVLVHDLRVHAFVLMPNHFHLIASSPECAIDVVMKEVLSSATRILNTKTRRSGHIFGGRYFWSLIREPTYYAHALKYVYRNPVKAGLCSAVSEYSFSTYSGLVGQVPLPLPLLPPPNGLGHRLPEDFGEMDVWLNSAHAAEQNSAIKQALRRKEFKFGVERSSRRQKNFDL